MKGLRRFIVRVANVIARRGDRRLREEMEEHLAEQTTENLRAGMSPREARRQAVLKFGAVETVREDYFAEQGLPLLEELTRDIRYALRLLARSPSFTIAAVITLGLGVGVNASLFSLIDAFGIRSLPVRDASTLVSIYQKYRGQVHARGVYGSPYYLSYPEYANYRDRSTSLSGLAAYAETTLALGGAAPQSVAGQVVSCDYFQVLGAKIAAGRGFSAADCGASASPAVILSNRFWQSHFGGDLAAVGKALTLNGQIVTIAGVAGPEFVGTELQVPDVWVPMAMASQLLPNTFGSRDWLALENVSWLHVIGHLKPGVSLRTARSELAFLGRQMDARYPGRQTNVTANSGSFLSDPEARTDGFWISIALFVLGGLVLMMACTNLANLLLSRGARRQQELVTRLALGATRRRLLTQLLTENMLLSALGGVAGVAVMLLLTPVLIHGLPGMPSGPLPVNLTPDSTTLSFAFSATLAAALLSGLLPALQASDLDLLTTLKEGGAAAGQGRRRARLRDLLVIAQVAGCALLLGLAGLLARGLHRVEVVAPGFATKSVYVLSFNLSERSYNATRAFAFTKELRDRLKTYPGADGVACSGVLPGVNANLTGVTIPGAERPEEEVLVNYVSSDYFRTMEIPILRGHPLIGEQIYTGDSSPAVISAAMARRFWPGTESIGKEFVAGQNRKYRVVGIAQNVSTMRLGQQDGPLFYGLLGESAGDVDTKMFLRTNGNGSGTVSAIPALVQQIDPNVKVITESYQQILSEQLLPARRGAILVSALGLLALLLAVVGVTGVVSLATSQRAREIGIRVAFGARPYNIVVLLLSHGVKLVVVGLTAGIGLAVGVAVLISSNGLLFGVSPTDPLIFVGTASLLFCSAVLSMLFPAYRALRLDPVIALRYQ